MVSLYSWRNIDLLHLMPLPHPSLSFHAHLSSALELYAESRPHPHVTGVGLSAPTSPQLRGEVKSKNNDPGCIGRFMLWDSEMGAFYTNFNTTVNSPRVYIFLQACLS